MPDSQLPGWPRFTLISRRSLPLCINLLRSQRKQLPGARDDGFVAADVAYGHADSEAAAKPGRG